MTQPTNDCLFLEGEDDIDSPKTDYVIIGNMNVGKSTLYERLSTAKSPAINIPGTTLSIKSGSMQGVEGKIYDTPGVYSLFSSNEDARASRDILLIPEIGKKIKGLILVADAKNLKRSIAIALQYAEYGLPMIMDINMIDEASSRGIEIDIPRLSRILGVDICTTIAREGVGVEKLRTALKRVRPPEIELKYSDRIEEFIALIGKLITPGYISNRAMGILLLSGDKSVESFIKLNCGDMMFKQLHYLVQEYRDESAAAIEITLENMYHRRASQIVDEVVTIAPPTKNPFILTFGDWCTQLSTGIPIALTVMTILYLFVGTFAATFLVDFINTLLFENMLIPWLRDSLQVIPSQFFRDMIIDPDFGVLPTGVFLAFGLVLPVIFCFYIAFGFLEDSGYLPRISILLNRIFRSIGLNGKGVIPLVMGFSCITMALLTTRMLDTEKERNIASFLIFLCMPCAPLIAVMLVILDKMPFHATATVFGIIFLQIFIAGFLADKMIPGMHSSFIMEIPAMRMPRPWAVIKMAATKSHHFMQEAVPVFICASIAVFLFQRVGGLDMLEKAAGPFIHKVLGLPEQSIQVFIKTMIRRESGAAELEHLRNSYTNLQLVVNLLVMTFIAPCINAIIVLFKERGGKAASAIMCTVIFYAFFIGSAVNYVCRMFEITFS